MTDRRGRCGCTAIFLALLLFPLMLAHPLLGVGILAFLLSRD